MIPVEALEAVLTVLRRDDLWELSDEEEARLILEAAAPYMLEQGWDEGYKAGLFDKEYYSHNPNPYRPVQ